MTLDILDTAFVRRLALAEKSDREPEPKNVRAAERQAPDPPTPSPPLAADPAPGRSGITDSDSDSSPGPGSRPGLVERLLTAAAAEWDALAGHVERARQRGRRVIGIAGGASGEGRTTLVACLAAALEARGREVVRLAAPEGDATDYAAGGPTHDKRIILVDAGIWFPPGPIRRQRLLVASRGCEAAILVRRAGGRGGPGRAAALESLGIEVLGEVLTFTDGAIDPAEEHAA